MPAFRVMIVDNQREVRRLLSGSLAALMGDFQVTEAVSGEEALLMLRLGQIDLMVSDIRLAGISGLELFEKARQQQPGIKVILIAAQPDAHTRQRSAAMGIQFFLDKPVDAAAYLAAVERLLGLEDALPPPPTTEVVLVEQVINDEPPEPGLAERLAALRQELSAVTAALLNENGQLVAQTGNPLEELLSPEHIPHVLGVWSAGVRLSIALGSGIPQGILYFPTRQHSMYLAPVGAALSLLLLCPPPLAAEHNSSIIPSLLSAIDDFLHIVARMGVPVTPEAPAIAEPPAPMDASPELLTLDPIFEALFSSDAVPASALQDPDMFWEAAADRDQPSQPVDTGSLSYDQARRLGLAPEDGPAGSGG